MIDGLVTGKQRQVWGFQVEVLESDDMIDGLDGDMVVEDMLFGFGSVFLVWQLGSKAFFQWPYCVSAPISWLEFSGSSYGLQVGQRVSNNFLGSPFGLLRVRVWCVEEVLRASHCTTRREIFG